MSPQVSVLIATHNRAEILRDTLEAMTQLEAPDGGWELIVIDNRSTDRTRHVCDSFQGLLPLVYRYEPRQGKNAALNSGIKIAKGQLFVFTDDDVTPEPDWLLQLCMAASSHRDVCVFGGPYYDRLPSTVPDWVIRATRNTVYVGDSHPDRKTGPYPPDAQPPGVNLAIRRSIFAQRRYRYEESVGPRGKGRISGSERELLYRLRDDGFVLLHVSTARVHHRWYEKQFAPRLLIRRSFGIGRGKARLRRSAVGVKHLWGIPRYLFRRYAEETASGFMGFLRGDWAVGLRAILRLSQYTGIAYQSLRQRQRKKIRSEPVSGGTS